MAVANERRINEPAPEQPSKSRCANYTTQTSRHSDRRAGAMRSAPLTEGNAVSSQRESFDAKSDAPSVSGGGALSTEHGLDEVLRQVRSGWKDRRLSKRTIDQREATVGLLEELAESAGYSVVTESLVSEAALQVKERYSNRGSQRVYLQALSEICSICGISCDEIPRRPLGPERKTKVPEKFEHVHKAYLDYLGAQGYAAGTVSSMGRTARQLLCFLSDRVDSIDQVTEDDMEAFLMDSLKSWKASTLPVLRQRIRLVAKYLVSWHGLPERSCCTLLEPMRFSPPPLQVTLTQDQVTRLIEAASTTPNRPKRTLAWLVILVQYAVRSKDLADLKLGDIDWVRGTITFAYTKTCSPRTFPLTEGVRYALLDYLRHERPATDCPYVFLPRKYPLKQVSNPESFTLRLQGLAYEAGLDFEKGFGCHALRRASATALLEGGLPYPDISNYLNHTQSGTAISGTAMRYLKVHTARLRTAALEVPDAK